MNAVPRIRPLPPLLIDQIAAGEVVERPASAVKELVENGLDAGASRIVVELEEGGARRIRVQDDGWGIEPEDLPLALARHATSKIGALEDLERVATLGFRGEALAALAAVARLRIVSRPAGRAHACAIEAAEGRIGPVEPAPGPPGTTVEVRDLFFSVPARRRFLRSARAETALVRQWLEALALAHPEVEFRLLCDGRERLRLAPGDARQRALAVLGEELGGRLIPLEREFAGVRLRGFVAPPAACGSRSDQQFFLVNRRPVRDRRLAHAVRSAYRDVLHHERQPVHVLELQLAPERVDVNVHPAKLEVRFRDGALIHDLLRDTLEQALATARGGHPATAAAAFPAWRPGGCTPRLTSPPRFGSPRPMPRSMEPPRRRHLGRRRRPRGAARPPARRTPLGRPLALLRHTWVLAESARGPGDRRCPCRPRAAALRAAQGPSSPPGGSPRSRCCSRPSSR
ncbi:MAG: DNA mismatch repair endonuclease MutL [Xanthomonadales bacterium]|nr:DNA mismatch repair endonuclease MutL [Xanthomonadales bacterium]